MKPIKIISDWLFGMLAGTFVEDTTLYVGMGSVTDGIVSMSDTVTDGEVIAGYALTGGRVYPLATKDDVKTPYVTYDDIVLNYGLTKDGAEPSDLTFRVICVERSYTGVGALADAVVAKINNTWIAEFCDYVQMQSRRPGYDPSTGEFLEELRFKIEI